MNAPLFRPEAVRHQRERLWGNVILTQPLPMRLVTLVVLVLLVALIAYLTWGTYTRKERVRGYLVPEAGLVQVYPARPGPARPWISCWSRVMWLRREIRWPGCVRTAPFATARE